MVYDKKQLTKVVSAIVISDGYLKSCKGNGNSNLQLVQTIDHKDLIDKVESYLRVLTSVTISKRVYEKDTHKDQLCLRTMRHPFYTKLRKRFYIEGKKVVDPHAMTLIDGEFLALWYMFDGTHTYREANKSHVLNLCTEAFSYGDHLLMQKALWDNCNLNFRIHRRKDKYKLYLPVKEYPKLISLIKPFIVDSFMYKLP